MHSPTTHVEHLHKIHVTIFLVLDCMDLRQKFKFLLSSKVYVATVKDRHTLNLLILSKGNLFYNIVL